MFATLTPVPTVLNVAASSTATIQVDPVGTYFGLRIYYTRSGVAATVAEIAADIAKIRVNLNGTTQWELTGAELQMQNAWRGISPANGEIPLWFHEPTRKEERVQDFRSWGMVGVDTFTVEIDLAASASTPAITCLRYWIPNPTVMGEIRKFKRQTVAIAATGDTVINTLPRNDRVLSMHCNSTVITNWKVKLNNFEMYNHAPVRLHNLAKEYGFTAQTGWSHLSFDFRNRGDVSGGTWIESADPFLARDPKNPYAATWPLSGYLPWEQTFTMSAATSFTLVRELSGLRE